MPSSARLSDFVRPIETPPAPSEVSAGKQLRWSGWLWPHLLGLDAPVVAVTWQGWWAATNRVQLPPRYYFILFLAVWLIYLADRQADAERALPGELLTDRHAFSGQHRKWLRPLLFAVAGTLALATPVLLSEGEFVAGLMLLGLAAVYYRVVHHWQPASLHHLPKEALVGGMFSLGSAFFTFSSGRQASGWFLVGTALFAGLCFLNCAFISVWEQSPQDLGDPVSLLNRFPQLTARLGRGALILAALSTVGACCEQSGSLVPVALGALALWGLHRHRLRLSVCALRVLADIVLLSPLLLLCWFAARR